MRSFTFVLPSESGLRARYQESATGDGERTTIAETLISDLPLAVNGKPLWDIVDADPTIYGWLSFFRGTGAAEVRSDSRLLAPQSANPALCNVVVKVRSLTGAAVQGVAITATPYALPAMSGDSLLAASSTTQSTDVAGIAVLPLLKNASYNLSGSPLGAGRMITIANESDLTLETFVG